MAQFELLEENILGEGSFGKVYQCHWHGSLAAAKLFNVDPGDEMKVSQEIEMLKELCHDYIEPIFGTAHHNGKLCLITSYAENRSLRHALSHHTLPRKQKPSIITGLLKGMSYLKSNHVIHRDLKSPNVLLDSNYAPKIRDFGLASLKQTSTQQVTPSSLETTRWMAPELFGKAPHYSFASDVYALGTVIWEILTENLPYGDYQESDAIRALIQQGQLEVIPDNIPEHYKVIVSNCWHFKPEDRISVERACQVNDEALPEVSFDLTAGNAPSEAEPTHYANVLDRYLQETSSDLDNEIQLAAVLQVHGDGFIQWIKAAANQNNAAAATVLGEMYYHGCCVPQDYQAAFKQFAMVAKEKENASDRNDSGTMGLSSTVSKQVIARAQCNLAEMYQDGNGVPQSNHKAVEWYTKAALQDCARAQHSLGRMYEDGAGVPQNDDKAFELYKKAAEQGDENAQYSLGRMYQEGKGVPENSHREIEWYMSAAVPDKAAEWYTKAAVQGHAGAQHELGLMYECGFDVPKNVDLAIEWYTKSAEQHNVFAQWDLGRLYENGIGFPQSDDKAIEWYTKSADQGYKYAQDTLISLFRDGRGVPQSDDQAAEWIKKATEQGKAYAQFCAGWIYENGRGVPQNDDQAVAWYTKAAEQGNAVAQFNLGRMYENGRGVQQSDEKAFDWYKKAAEKHDGVAQYRLAQMYENGQGVQQDDLKAAEWYVKVIHMDAQYKAVELYTKVAEQGDAEVQFKLAQIYANSIGPVRNSDKAGEWYMKAAENGHVNAQLRLAWRYEFADGVPKSMDKAVEWYKKAAEQGNTGAQDKLAWLYEHGRIAP